LVLISIHSVKGVSEFSFWVVSFSKTEEMGGAHRGVVGSKFLGESNAGEEDEGSVLN